MSETPGKETPKKQKIAVMGGTFDPIHTGHLLAAEAVRHAFGIGRVLFIPSGRPAHKPLRPVTAPEHRYAMALLATAENPRFEVSRLEIDRKGATYTIDTLRALAYPPDDLYFITGADALVEIPTWKDAADLMRLCRFVGVNRPGVARDALEGRAEEMRRQYGCRIDLLDIPALEISSTDIRGRVLVGRPVKYLLPGTVESYIRKNHLYETAPAVDLEALRKHIKQHLGEKRYQHTMGVAAEAVKLANRYGLDSDKAYLAALLHDCAKEIPGEEKLALAKAYGLGLDPILTRQPDLLHSFLAAELAKRQFGVNDQEVLDAIAYHTTGRAGMAPLEKVLFIADAIEPHRAEYPVLAELRRLAYTDLNRAVILSLRGTISYNQAKRRDIHPFGLEALADLEKQEGQV